MAVSRFQSNVWKITGMTPAQTPQIQLPAASVPVGAQAIDVDNNRLFEVGFNETADRHAWYLIRVRRGSGTAIIDFGSPLESQTASVAVGGQADISAGAIMKAWITDGPTADHSEDEHRMASTAIGLTCGSITPGVGFVVYGTSQAGYTGQFLLNWSWENP